MKISKANAEHYIWGSQCDGWHLAKGSNLSVIHERMPANSSEVNHYHEVSRQFFFVLSGTATIVIDGHEIVLEPHEGVEVAPLTVHQMFNKSDRDIEFLVISQPTSHGDRVVVE
ncbi:cupin domain-containing protein [Paenibacillus sp. NPDC058071]|uniref:cupin domain-containing protein n=1 Tax=Paenibacillus sp. NPDC058071 TaxID=3346326 RepID=UPI0036DE09FF